MRDESQLQSQNERQGDIVRVENEAILALIAAKKLDEAYDRATRNLDRAAATGSDALKGNCAFTIARAQHELGLLSGAVTAYAQAAETAIRSDNQRDVARIHICMATALMEMFEGDRRSNLEKAIACQKTALATCTEASRPLDYANLQYNMGCAYAELTTEFAQEFARFFEDWAKRCFQNAARAFRNLGMYHDARSAEDASEQPRRILTCPQVPTWEPPEIIASSGHINQRELEPSALKTRDAESLFQRALSAAQLGRFVLAVQLMKKSSAIVLEMIQAGEDKHNSRYARTNLNLAVFYNELGATNYSLQCFVTGISMFRMLVLKGRSDLIDELAKAESVLHALYPGTVIDRQSGTVARPST